MSLFSRIKKRLDSTAKSFKTDCSFSVNYAFLRLIDELGGRIGLTSLSKKAHNKKDQWIRSYLLNDLKSVIEKFNDDDYSGEYEENAPIWVCWWTGEETAPDLVKQCIKSIRAKAGTHPVYVIDEKNYTDYLNIPEYIIDKVNSKQICLANFSDYLRVSLIAKFGGLWIDSTVYCADNILDDYFSLPFFTCKSETKECGYVSQMRWTAFILGGWKNNLFFRYMNSALDEYWKKHNASIDYLLVDYLIEMGYNEIPAIKELIDNVPINNIHRDDLQTAMNDALPAEEFESVINEDTILYKLSWREKYSLTAKNGRSSVYSHFLKTDFEEHD